MRRTKNHTTQQLHTRVTARTVRRRRALPPVLGELLREGLGAVVALEVPARRRRVELDGMVQQTMRCGIEPRLRILFELGAAPGALRAVDGEPLPRDRLGRAPAPPAAQLVGEGAVDLPPRRASFAIVDSREVVADGSYESRREASDGQQRRHAVARPPDVRDEIRFGTVKLAKQLVPAPLRELRVLLDDPHIIITFVVCNISGERGHQELVADEGARCRRRVLLQKGEGNADRRAVGRVPEDAISLRRIHKKRDVVGRAASAHRVRGGRDVR